MLSFERKIKTSIGNRTFLFKKVYRIDGYRYNVSVFGHVTNNYFSLIKDGHGWVFNRPNLVSDWIAEVHFELINTIEQNELE